MLTVALEPESTQVFACLHASLPHQHGIPLNLTLFSPFLVTLLQEGNFKEISKLMKEISFKIRKNYEQNRKFCVVKVETLFTVVFINLVRLLWFVYGLCSTSNKVYSDWFI